MKKVLFLLFAVCFSVTMFAVDVIVTKDSQRINAKIEEVGLDVVKYRRSDNLKGPLYTLAKADILTILYENGTTETFSQTQQPQQTRSIPQSKKPTTSNYDGQYYNINTSNSDFLVREGSVIFQNGQALSKQAYQNLLKNTCPVAFQQYKKGLALINSGYGMLAAGTAFMIGIGVPLYCCCVDYNSYYNDYNIDYGMLAGGISMMTIGGAVIASSVPMICVGYVKRNRSVDTYNNSCSPAITCNITAGQNGLGLALNF